MKKPNYYCLGHLMLKAKKTINDSYLNNDTCVKNFQELSVAAIHGAKLNLEILASNHSRIHQPQ